LGELAQRHSGSHHALRERVHRAEVRREAFKALRSALRSAERDRDERSALALERAKRRNPEKIL